MVTKRPPNEPVAALQKFDKRAFQKDRQFLSVGVLTRILLDTAVRDRNSWIVAFALFDSYVAICRVPTRYVHVLQDVSVVSSLVQLSEMDALAGYGSDSSSASSVEKSGSNPTETGQSSGNDKLLKANVCGSRALSGLLHYSDNEVDERTEPQQVGNSESGQQGKESGDSEADRTYSVIGVAVSTDEFPPLKKKRPRRAASC